MALVDFDAAHRTGARLVGPGPSVSAQEAAEVVAQLRRCAREATQPVADTARLHAPAPSDHALVLDRPGWIGANTASMEALLAPALAVMVARRDEALARRGDQGKAPSATTTARMERLGAAGSGAEMGALLAFMASRVLGQYDLAPAGAPALLLVAPNVLAAEQELELDPSDFRMWVCLHEETHRVQFTAVPWLRDHMIATTRELAADLVPDPEALSDRLTQLVRRLPEITRENGPGLAELTLTKTQRHELERVSAVMSLLEGHADVVMDDVGPVIVPTVATIRERFTARRRGMSSLDRLLRRALGLEAKMRQYRDGAAFVRHVVERVGWEDFNAIWTSPQTLPGPGEIADPAAWVHRVHG